VKQVDVESEQNVGKSSTSVSICLDRYVTSAFIKMRSATLCAKAQYPIHKKPTRGLGVGANSPKGWVKLLRIYEGTMVILPKGQSTKVFVSICMTDVEARIFMKRTGHIERQGPSGK
jgi:hypothetical protein